MRAALLAFPVLGVVLLACGSSSSPSGADGQASRVASPIIGGSDDTTHDAVIALIAIETDPTTGQPLAGACTGTIVKVDATRHVGWVATAAHCVEKPPTVVFMGPDYNDKSAIRYEILDYAADPQYSRAGDGTLHHDFAMVRILGVDGTTPIIPLTSSPDGLSVGTTVTSVGYGLTVGGGSDNSVRHQITKSIAALDSFGITYSQQSTGICNGDSGGPVLLGSGSSQRVVGIHSTVSNGACTGAGNSDRVTNGLSFFSGQLAQSIPPEDCGMCTAIATSGKSECTAYIQACQSDKDCSGFYDCVSKGGSRTSCLAKFPKAEGPFNAAANCACTRACASKCAGSVECSSVPKCGFKLPAGDCTTCTEGACCTETLDCAADGTCYLCLKTKDAAPECATNAKRKAMATCVASKCKTQCAGTGLDTGADPSVPEGSDGAGSSGQNGGGGGTTTITTSGCSASPTGSGGLAAGWLAAALATVLLGRRRSRRA